MHLLPVLAVVALVQPGSPALPSSERRLTIDSAHRVLATSPMTPDLGIAKLRSVVATYSEVLAAETAEAPRVPLAGLLAAAQSDLGSMERRDSAALRSAVQQYTAVAGASGASPGERRAALLRVRQPRGELRAEHRLL